jgi:hypothetical protein
MPFARQYVLYVFHRNCAKVGAALATFGVEIHAVYAFDAALCQQGAAVQAEEASSLDQHGVASLGKGFGCVDYGG